MKIRKQRLPSSRKIKKYGPPYFRCQNMVCGKNMVCGQNIFAVRKCSDTHTQKNMSLISHKTSIFHYRNIFGNMLCLSVFPASEIDNPLCLRPIKSFGTASRENRSSVNSHCACPDRCYVYHLCRLAQFVYVNYAYRVNISVELHRCVG